MEHGQMRTRPETPIASPRSDFAGLLLFLLAALVLDLLLYAFVASP
jgi:hypothetical protein